MIGHMRSPFRSMLVALALVASGSPFAAGADRPNILWLIAEDFGTDLGCYGREQVWTPNLDRLAADGVRYSRFYTTAPVCSPSRSAFMTGMYQTTIGAHRVTDLGVSAGGRDDLEPTGAGAEAVR